MTVFLYLLTICIPCGVVLLIFAMKYISSARQAQSRALAENAYREVAEKAVAVQSANATSLSAIQIDLAETKTRLAAIEKVLKAVE